MKLCYIVARYDKPMADRAFLNDYIKSVEAFVKGVENHQLLEKAGAIITNDENDKFFQQVINSALKFNLLPISTLADKLNISKPTLERWKDGKHLPHVVMRDGIVEYLKRVAIRKIANLV